LQKVCRTKKEIKSNGGNSNSK